jgi:hypothetical protein
LNTSSLISTVGEIGAAALTASSSGWAWAPPAAADVGRQQFGYLFITLHLPSNLIRKTEHGQVSADLKLIVEKFQWS